jgi:hypothetical protein
MHYGTWAVGDNILAGASLTQPRGKKYNDQADYLIEA